MNRLTRCLRMLAVAALLTLTALGVWQAAGPSAPATPRGRAVAVEQTLRCPTCQGLSVADSPSPIAAGIRQQVEQQLATGATPEQVRDYFVGRYGDWILLDPPRRGVGWLVWLAPTAALLSGGLLMLHVLRRRPTKDGAEVSPEQLRAAGAFAADPPAAELVEPVAAALADLRAARLEAELDPAAETPIADRTRRLACALRDHPEPVVDQPHLREPSQEQESSSSRGGRVRGHRSALIAVTTAAVFAALLALTLSRATSARPAGAVLTGTFATAAPGAAPTGPDPDQLAALTAATREQPANPEAWRELATALDRAGRLAEAETAYRTLLTLEPSDTAATEQYASLLIRGGAAAEALRVLAPLAVQRPDDPQILLLLGLAQRSTGDQQAATTLQRFLALVPHDPQAATVRGLLGPPR